MTATWSCGMKWNIVASSSNEHEGAHGSNMFGNSVGIMLQG